MLRSLELTSGPNLKMGRRRLPLFQICGSTGMLLALATAAVLTMRTGLSIGVTGAIAVAGVLTFFGLTLSTKLLTGEEQLVYYHHEIGVMAVVALLLWALRRPLLPYLDITILGIGVLLACGRIGCLLVGCCHGRPRDWGVRYGEEHAAAGFPSCLVGVRLFPIQAVESLLVFSIVAVGTWFVWSGRPPGTALAWYVVTYDVGRFTFEFARGDADRPYWRGFSQAQWLALLLTGLIVCAELTGILPLLRWHLATFALLAVTLIAVSVRRRLQKTLEFQLLHPRHVQQVASAMKRLGAPAGRVIHPLDGTPTVVSVARTSLGIRISGGQIDRGAERVHHYTLSQGRDLMTEATARSLAGLIRRLNGAVGSPKLIAGNQGVFHLLICVPAVKNS
jgi:hypothetical protein